MGGVEIQEPARRLGSTSRRAARSPWIERMARYGLVAKGVSYGLVGVLAIAVAVSGGGETTSRQGALAAVVDESYRPFLIVVLALGFASYALWLLVEAIFDRSADGTDVGALAKRAGYLVRAAVYAALTYGAVELLLGRNENRDRERHQATARVLEWPAGALARGARGSRADRCRDLQRLPRGHAEVEKKWETSEMSPAPLAPARRIAGLLSRFVVFSLIGIFVVKAGYEYDPKQTIGLDGALEKLPWTGYGPVLLFVVAAGLVCYGLFSLVEAGYRRTRPLCADSCS